MKPPVHRIICLVSSAAVALAWAGCGGGDKPSRGERLAACAQQGLVIDSDECADEVTQQRKRLKCIEGTMNGDERACDDMNQTSAVDLERQISATVKDQFGVALDSIDCGADDEIEKGAVVECPFSAQGHEATMIATVTSLGPPMKVSVDMDTP